MTSTLETNLETLQEVFQDVKSKKEAKDSEGVQKSLDEAVEVLEQLKIEVHSVSNKDKKAQYVAKIKDYEKKVQEEKRLLLVGPEPASRAARGEDEVQQQSLDRLKAAHQQLLESEEVAADTLTHLQQQRETLTRTRDNAKEVNAELQVSNNFLNRMGKWWRR